MNRSPQQHRPRQAAEPTARDVMRADVLVIAAEMTVPEVWDAMQRTGNELAVVMYGGTYAGVVELNAVCLGRFLELAPVPRWVLPLALAVPAVSPDEPLRHVCRVLLRSPAGVVVVVDDAGLHGIVTLREIVTAIASADDAPIEEASHAL